MLYGYEIDDTPHERLFEWMVVFGHKQLVPTDRETIRDLAFQHFSSAVYNIEKPKSQFIAFMKQISDSVKTSVLLLGSYRSHEDAEDFATLKNLLLKFGYHGFMLKDAPDVSLQSNREKLLCGITASLFIIVFDSEPSGHISEITEMLSHPFRPAIIIRRNEVPTTAFTEDSIQVADHLRVAVLPELTERTLLPHIQWAKAYVRDKEDQYNSINAWRNDDTVT